MGGMRGRDDAIPGAPYDEHALSRLSEPPAGLLALLAAREEASAEFAQQLADAIEALVLQDVVQELARDELGPGKELLHERLELAPGLRRDESLRVAGLDLIAQPRAGDERQGLHPLRMAERHLRGDGSAQGMANEMGATDLHRIEEANHEARQLAKRPTGQGAIGLAVPGQVESHHRALLAQRIDIEEPVVEIAPEAVDEQHCPRGVALPSIANPDTPDIDELVSRRGRALFLLRLDRHHVAGHESVDVRIGHLGRGHDAQQSLDGESLAGRSDPAA